MAKQYLFRIQLLNKKDFNPLNIVAYYSGQIQLNAFNKEKFMPDSKKQVMYSNLLVPQGDLYKELPDYLQINGKKKDIIDNARNIMWKNIDFFEKRFDSQFARLFEVYAPWFCTPEEVKKLMNNYAGELTKSGMVADVSVHKTNTADNSLFSAETAPKTEHQQDYSCFLLCTLRPFENGLFQKKNREWNGQDKLIVWRQTWVDMLKKTVQAATADELVKKQWLDKLNIYPESNNNFKPKI